MRYLTLFLVCLFSTTFACSQSAIPNGFIQGTIVVPGDSDDWIATNQMVNAEDFVIFEVAGKVTVGAFAGSTSGERLHNSAFIGYNRFQNIPHGALVARNGDQIVFAKNSTTVFNFSAEEKLAWHSGFSEDDFIGYYFVSKQNQELKFAINDRDYGNNVGNYTVTYTIIPARLHVNRNQFNRCPRKEPVAYADISTISICHFEDSLCHDNTGLIWATSLCEKFYHGGGWAGSYSNRTYRGESPTIKGCQCTYNSNGVLVNNNLYMGTYDYSFGLPGLTAQQMKFHMLWDVLPHDAYVVFYKDKNLAFKYLPTQIIY